MQNRRSFLQRVSLAIAASAYATMTGCSFQSAEAQIEAWVKVGLQSFASVVQILQGAGITIPGGALVAFIPQAIGDAFSLLDNAIAAYNAAPSAQKSTLVGKISTALSALEGQIQTFWSELNIPDSKTASLIQGLLGVLVSTLMGFGALLPTSASVALMARPANGRFITYVPKHRSHRQFRNDFNAFLKGTPYEHLAIK